MANENAALHGVEHEIKGRNVVLLFTYGALKLASKKLREQGVKANLLLNFNPSKWDADILPAVFFAAALANDPELTYEECDELVDMETWDPLFVKLVDAYEAALPKAKDEDAPVPQTPAETQS